MLSSLRLCFVLVALFITLSALVDGSPTAVVGPGRTARPLKHVTRTTLVERANRPKNYKRQSQTSATPYPASEGGFVSTGSVPWAVFTNLDIDCRDNTFASGSFQNQESCHTLCRNTASRYLRDLLRVFFWELTPGFIVILRFNSTHCRLRWNHMAIPEQR
jgi:hypothetical protein